MQVSKFLAAMSSSGFGCMTVNNLAIITHIIENPEKKHSSSSLKVLFGGKEKATREACRRMKMSGVLEPAGRDGYAYILKVNDNVEKIYLDSIKDPEILRLKERLRMIEQIARRVAE